MKGEIGCSVEGVEMRPGSLRLYTSANTTLHSLCYEDMMSVAVGSVGYPNDQRLIYMQQLDAVAQWCPSQQPD